jgi:hypothetical protein
MKQIDQYHEIIGRLTNVHMDGRGLTARCPLASDVSRHPNGDRTPSFRAWIGKDGELVCKCMGCQCDWRDVAKALGIPLTAFFPGQLPKSTIRPRRVADYHYYDGRRLVAIKIRYEPGFIAGKAKDFMWKRPLLDQGWAKGLDAGHYVQTKPGWWVIGEGTGQDLPKVDVSGLLYGTIRIEENRDAPVIVCESEKDCDLLYRLRVAAVCPPYGCGKWTRAQSELLRGRRVVVVSDDGQTAVDHAARVAGSLLLTASAVRLVVPGGTYRPPTGKGVGNWLETMPEMERRPALATAVKEQREWRSVA